MSYKIKINDLKSAIYEAAMQRKSEYEGLKFVDRIFKENKDHIGKIKKIIKENKDNGKAVYDYLLNECGCSSKYDGVRDYMPTYEEEEILFDLEEEWDEMNPYATQSLDDFRGELEDDYKEKFPSMDDEFGNTSLDDYSGYAMSKGIDVEDDFIPEYWIAEQMFEGVSKKKKAHMKGMSEQEIMEQVQMMEKQGYSLTAFRNEAEMNEYLSGDNTINESINKSYKTFVVSKSDGKILNGYDYEKDKLEMDEVKEDIRDRDEKPSDYKVITLSGMQKKGIDPFDPSNWVGYNPSKKKLNEYNDNLPPGISDQDIEDYMGDADDEYGEYPLILRLSDVYGDDFIKELLDELSDYESQYSSEQKLETELENYLKYNQFSTYDDTPFSEENMMKINIVLNDISSMNENAGDEDADSYYNTWSGAVEAAIKRAEKRGYYFTEEDNFPIINHHNQQRRKEETSSFSLPLYRKHEKIIISKIRRNEEKGIFFLNTNVDVSNAIKKMSRDIYESNPDAVILNDDKYLYNVLRPLLEGNEVDEVMLQLFKEEEKKLQIRIYDRDTDKGRFELVSYIS